MCDKKGSNVFKSAPCYAQVIHILFHEGYLAGDAALLLLYIAALLWLYECVFALLRRFCAIVRLFCRLYYATIYFKRKRLLCKEIVTKLFTKNQ